MSERCCECGGRIGEREIAARGIGQPSGESFALHQKCLGWKVIAVGEVPDIRIVQSTAIPRGALLLVPPRRQDETDEELARRCVLLKEIGDGV